MMRKINFTYLTKRRITRDNTLYHNILLENENYFTISSTAAYNIRKELITLVKKEKPTPAYSNISWLIKKHTIFQNKKVIRYYKQLNPSYQNVRWLITCCPFCQTKNMVKYYKQLKPDYNDISWLIISCEFCQSKKIRKILKRLKY